MGEGRQELQVTNAQLPSCLHSRGSVPHHGPLIRSLSKAEAVGFCHQPPALCRTLGGHPSTQVGGHCLLGARIRWHRPPSWAHKAVPWFGCLSHALS